MKAKCHFFANYIWNGNINVPRREHYWLQYSAALFYKYTHVSIRQPLRRTSSSLWYIPLLTSLGFVMINWQTWTQPEIINCLSNCLQPPYWERENIAAMQAPCRGPTEVEATVRCTRPRGDWNNGQGTMWFQWSNHMAAHNGWRLWKHRYPIKKKLPCQNHPNCVAYPRPLSQN